MGKVIPLSKAKIEPRSPAAEVPPHESIKAEGVRVLISVAKHAGRNYMYTKDKAMHWLRPETARAQAERDIAIATLKEALDEMLLEDFEKTS